MLMTARLAGPPPNSNESSGRCIANSMNNEESWRWVDAIEDTCPVHVASSQGERRLPGSRSDSTDVLADSKGKRKMSAYPMTLHFCRGRRQCALTSAAQSISFFAMNETWFLFDICSLVTVKV